MRRFDVYCVVSGVGVDDMFILISGWRQTDVDADTETRVAQTFRSSAISVTITSLTDLLAFCIGATSPFLNVKNFCVFTGKSHNTEAVGNHGY